MKLSCMHRYIHIEEAKQSYINIIYIYIWLKAFPVLWQAFRRLGLNRPSFSFTPSLRTLLDLDGRFNLELRVAFLHSAMVDVHKLRGYHCHIACGLREKYVRDTFKDQICSDNMLRNVQIHMDQRCIQPLSPLRRQAFFWSYLEVSPMILFCYKNLDVIMPSF